MRALLAAVLFAAGPAPAYEQEVQRALIERDQRSAEFAAGVNRPALEALHERQRREAGEALHPDAQTARQLRPYERERMAREREHVLRLPPPVGMMERRPEPPRPLPGLPQHLVEPVREGS
jgi:hypothetical protein